MFVSRHLPFAGLVLLGLLWGSEYLFIKTVVAEVSPLTLVWGQLLVGAGAVTVSYRLTGAPLPRARILPNLAPLALLGIIFPYFLIAWGTARMPSGLVAVLIATVPLMTAALASLALPGEKTPRGVLASLCVGLAGVGILGGDELLALRAGEVGSDLAAYAAVLAGGGCWAIYSIYVRRTLRAENVYTLILSQVWFGAVLMTPIVWWREDLAAVDLGWKVAASWTLLGLITAALGPTLFFWLVRRLGAVVATFPNYLGPVVALTLGWLVLSEPLTVQAVAGALAVLTGLAVLQASQRARSGAELPVAAAPVTAETPGP